MYDPEFNLLIQSQLEECRAATQRVRELVGVDHPATKLFEAFDEALEVFESMRNDYENCFDEGERVELKKELADFLHQLTDLYTQLRRKLT